MNYFKNLIHNFIENSYLKFEEKISILLNDQLVAFSSSLEESIKKKLKQSIFPFSSLHSASDLYVLWSEININLDYWNECELILACPLTMRGARELFTDKEIVEIRDGSNLKDLFAHKQDRKYKNIGIISPQILTDLCTDRTLLLSLLQLCRQQVIFLTGLDPELTDRRLRQFFHKAGFYEVLIVNEHKKIDFSSVNIFQDGTYTLCSSVPGTPLNNDWTTYIASRISYISEEEPLWREVYGSMQLTEYSESTSSPGQLSLSIKQAVSPQLANKQLIKCVMKWKKCYERESIRHASLVGCYSGPGDTNMYAAMVEVLNDDLASISLWRNDGVWERLRDVAVSPKSDLFNESEYFYLPLWIKITKSSVSVGTEDNTLFSLNDTKLARVSTLGARIFGNQISISDITNDFF